MSSGVLGAARVAPVRVVPLRWPLPVLAAAVLTAYLVRPPRVPDLAAQVSRAQAVRRGGATVWWPGWYGGLQTPSYSLLSPSVMALLGVTFTGALAAFVTVVAGSRALAGALRPMAGTTGLLATSVADVVGGRITFAVSLAFACCCAATLRSYEQRPSRAVLVALAALACASSPLGGLFLGLGAVASAVVDRRRRPGALLVAGTLVLVMVGQELLFPDDGRMPLDPRWIGLAVGSAVLVALTCRVQLLRVAVVLYLLLVLAFVLVPLGVGSNTTRLAWLLALPLVLAYGEAPRLLLPAAVAAAAVFPALDLSGQLAAARVPASAEAFFTPLSRALAQERLAHPESNGQRLEVVDPRGHWATVYLADEQLARGWERQVDRIQNPLFYGGARLDAASYRAWLDGLAVGWVALPSGSLDYAAVAEAALVRHGLAYLQPVWASGDWTLYRVLDPAPLVTGASVLAVDDEAVVISVPRAGRVHLAVRWSPYLVVTDQAGGPDGAVARGAGGETVATLDRPGTYRVTADFDGTLVRVLRSWAPGAGRAGARG